MGDAFACDACDDLERGRPDEEVLLPDDNDWDVPPDPELCRGCLEKLGALLNGELETAADPMHLQDRIARLEEALEEVRDERDELAESVDGLSYERDSLKTKVLELQEEIERLEGLVELVDEAEAEYEEVSEDVQEDDAEDLPLEDRLDKYVAREMIDGELRRTSTAIAEDLEVDGRKIPPALKRLDIWDVEKGETPDDAGGAEWIITPKDDEDVQADDPQRADEPEGEEAHQPDADTVYVASNRGSVVSYHERADCQALSEAVNVYERDRSRVDDLERCPKCNVDGDGDYCAICNQGPYSGPLGVAQHHVRAGHDGRAKAVDVADLDGEPVSVHRGSYDPTDYDRVDEDHERVAEWVLERLPDIDGGTLVVPTTIADDLDVPVGSVLKALRRMRGVVVEDTSTNHTKNIREHVVRRDGRVDSSELGELGPGDRSDAVPTVADDIDEDDVVDAAEAAETIADLGDKLGISTEAALRLLGYYELSHLVTGEDPEEVPA